MYAAYETRQATTKGKTMLSYREILQYFSNALMGDAINVPVHPLSIRSIEHAFVVPSLSKDGERWWTRVEQGVFDSYKNHITCLSDMRQERRIYWPSDNTYKALNGHFFTVEDEWIYGGTIYGEFGHLLTDSFSRLYRFLADEKYDSLTIAFHCSSPVIWESFKKSPIYSFIGMLNRNVVLIDRPYQVRKLIYTDSLFQDGRHAHISMHDYMSRTVYRLNALLRHQVIENSGSQARFAYISRSKLTKGTNSIVNEIEIENFAEELGFDIVHPQEIDIQSQLKVFYDYDLICGFPSSFYHLKLFTKGKANVILLIPNEKDALHINFINIEVASAFKDRYVVLSAIEEKPQIGFFRSRRILENDFQFVMKQIASVASSFSSHQLDKDVSEIDVIIISHISGVGDMISPNGALPKNSDLHSIEGFILECSMLSFEYRVLQRGSEIWSDWISSGSFAGSRGRSLPLVGFAVRLAQEHRDRYILSYNAKFAGYPNEVFASNGEDCVLDGFSALCAMRIVLRASSVQNPRFDS